MKRSTALLLAIATLLAHVLTLQQDARGRIGYPTDEAHSVYRLGRQAVHGGTLAWNSGGEVVESVASWLWVLVSIVAQRLYVGPNVAAQVLGVLAALGTLVVVSRFSPDRLAGVIAPALCTVSGTIAVAAASGTELAVFGFLAASALLAYQSHATRATAVLLALACALRPEGVGLVAGVGAIALVDRWRGAPRVGRGAFVWPLAALAAIVLARRGLTGEWLSPTAHHALDASVARVALGGRYVLEGLAGTGAPLLVGIPLLLLAVGHLSSLGRRALLLGSAWCAWVAWQGGAGTPFWAVLAPGLPLLFLAVQEATIRVLDGERVWARRGAWGLFAVGIGASTLASRVPSDLGPIPLRELQRAWQAPERSVLFESFDVWPGREGQRRAVERSDRQRAIGLWARERLPVDATLLVTAPGSIAYLSRRTVWDLLGRATPERAGGRPRAWFGPPRADLLATLDRGADYVVPFDKSPGEPLDLGALVERWLVEHDVVGPTPERRAALWERLRGYELVAVPLPEDSRDLAGTSDLPLFVLRNRELDLSPVLDVRTDGERFVVEVRHRAGQQFADLAVSLVDGEGKAWSLAPTGEFVEHPDVHARTGLLLHTTGGRLLRLFEGTLPARLQPRELRAVLRNPGTEHAGDRAQISNTVVVTL